MDANFGNRGELFLEHAHDGEDLEIAKAKLTLENLFKVWTRPVNLKTLLEDEVRLMRFDGQQHQFDAFE
jgi:stage V sporulation protein R